MSTFSQAGFLCVVLACNTLLSIAQAQDYAGYGAFELYASDVDSKSIANVTADELTVRDANRQTTRYRRSTRYDTTDQKWIGYASREAQQVIRWPVSGAGRMQIGTLQNGQVQFDWSKMTIRSLQQTSPLGSNGEVMPPGINGPQQQFPKPGDALLPQTAVNLPQATAMHLSVGGASNDQQFLTLINEQQIGFANQATTAEAAWYITPVSQNVVRLQQRSQNRWLAIGMQSNVANNAFGNRTGNRRQGGFGNGAFPRGGSFGGGGGFRSTAGLYPISLSPIHNGADQLWRIQNIASGGYCFESVQYPGMSLTCMPGVGLSLQPMTYDPWQIWNAQTPVFSLPTPQFRTVNQQVIPNAPLPPAAVRIVNSHADTLMILLADRRNPQKLQKLRIPAGGSERVQLERDSGATIMETVETLDPFGNWTQQEYRTPIPPNVLYDISVYEEFLQSIAIDRTGKSPSPIEDVNYQPRSVGFFLVPAGEELPEISELDAYQIAEEAQNPGAVRRLSQRDLEKKSSTASPDPLKDLLNQFQKQRTAF